MSPTLTEVSFPPLRHAVKRCGGSLPKALAAAQTTKGVSRTPTTSTRTFIPHHPSSDRDWWE